MSLWILVCLVDTGPGFDCANAFVVREKNETEARGLASQKSGDEGQGCWLDSKRSSCEQLSVHGKAGIILRDF